MAPKIKSLSDQECIEIYLYFRKLIMEGRERDLPFTILNDNSWAKEDKVLFCDNFIAKIEGRFNDIKKYSWQIKPNIVIAEDNKAPEAPAPKTKKSKNKKNNLEL
jgi:hypothetical protein